MRGTTIGRRIPPPAKFLPAAPFSTGRGRGLGGFPVLNPRAPGNPQTEDSPPVPPESSPSGFARGRGRGLQGPPKFDFTAKGSGKPSLDETPETPPSGLGHGRGKPSFDPVLPSFSSFQSAIGRGRGTIEPGPSRAAESAPPKADQFTQPMRPFTPPNGASTLQGSGRGKPTQQPSQPTKEENRHIQARPTPKPSPKEGPWPVQPKMSREEAVKKAMNVLSRDGNRDRQVDASGGRGRGGPAQGRGRGRGRGRGFWGEGRGRGRMREEKEEDEDSGDELYLGDDADGEKLAKRIGVENMGMLAEAFEEISERVLPSPLDDAFVDAFDTNCKIEFEPEYLMGEFDQNPDIDEEPPMPLRDVLEKVKPFMMAYEGIRSQEEWEEVVEETMKNAPLIKEIVDHYSGPDRVTAKKQQEELERVAKTIPASAPASVKRFTDRAVLSLQSNPGWGFDKKCQFMDKLVWEVSRHYH